MQDEIPFSAALGPAGSSHGWLTGAQVPTSTPYGMRYFSLDGSVVKAPTPLNPLVGFNDRNDYWRAQAFGNNDLFVFSRAGGDNNASVMWQVTGGLPTLAFSSWSPALNAPIFTSGTGSDAWSDFAIASLQQIFTCGAYGVTVWQNTGTVWVEDTTDRTVRDIGFCGISNDGATLYVVANSQTAGTSQVYSFHAQMKQYNNNGLPILTAPSGFQYRGALSCYILFQQPEVDE